MECCYVEQEQAREDEDDERGEKLWSENEKRKFHDSIFNVIFHIKVQRTRTLLLLLSSV